VTRIGVGIDIGTSGARAVAMSPHFEVLSQGSARLDAFGNDHRSPAIWWSAVEAALSQCLSGIDPVRVGAISVDGTSGTVVVADGVGQPLAPPLMYNDRVDDPAVVERIESLAPAHSAALGPTSGLAKMLVLQDVPGAAFLLHQADWVAGRLAGRFGFSDQNNALKSGFDPIAGRWPEWIGGTGLRHQLLPQVAVPGDDTDIRRKAVRLRQQRVDRMNYVAGTTDGCASFVATGADQPGDAVTVLGSTLTLKMLSDRPIFSPRHGVYSHRILGHWLAGGASNTGGKVLGHFFDSGTIERLSEQIDAAPDTGLDYYPLVSPGERFPNSDPEFQPRLEPRPTDDAQFLQGMFEGIAAIERRGYALLTELGAPQLRSVRSMGGGAANPVWTRIRQRRLGVDMPAALSPEAAAGTARLALAGLAK
jgi:sugar (pentulose or hexulose) kinase